MRKNSLTNIILRCLIVFFYFSIVGLSGCTYKPVARDDFSVLGNDIFSNMIKNSYSEKLLKYKATTGVYAIDWDKAQKISLDDMRGKSARDVSGIFQGAGGVCDPVLGDILSCTIVRRWKLKNIGAPFDTTNWSDPAVKIIHNFRLSNIDVVLDVNLEIVNVTENKKIYIK